MPHLPINYLQSLPSELILRILLELPPAEIWSLRRVCRHFEKACTDAFSHSLLRHSRPFTLQIMVTPSVSSGQSMFGMGVRPSLKIVECAVVNIDVEKQIVTLGMNHLRNETDFILDLEMVPKSHRLVKKRKQIRPDILTRDLVVPIEIAEMSEQLQQLQQLQQPLPRHEFRISALLHCNLRRMPNYSAERERARQSLFSLCNPTSPTLINTDKTYTLYDTMENTADINDHNNCTSFENTITSLEMEFPYMISESPDLQLTLQPIQFSYSYLFQFLVSKPYVHIPNIVPLRGKERLARLKSALTERGLDWREGFWTYVVVGEYLLCREEMNLEEVVAYIEMVEGILQRRNEEIFIC
jgi:hypothetical protein